MESRVVCCAGDDDDDYDDNSSYLRAGRPARVPVIKQAQRHKYNTKNRDDDDDDSNNQWRI